MKFRIFTFGFIFISLLILFVVPVNTYKKFSISEIPDASKKIDISKNMFKQCLGIQDSEQKCARAIVKEQIKNHKFDTEFLTLMYKNLNDLLAEHVVDESYCHEVAHEIGYQTNLKTGNIKTSLEFDPFQVSNSFLCANGYIHGILGNSVESLKIQKKIIYEMAEMFQSPDFKDKHYQYVSGMHEIGHYVLQVNNSDIPKAITMCKEISKSRENELSCYTGLFMEFFDKTASVGISMPIDECTKFDGLAGYTCFFVTNHSPKWLSNKNNLEKMLNLCNSFDGDIKHFSCDRRMLMEPLGKKVEGAREIETKFCLGQNRLDYKMNCLFLLSFDLLRFYPNNSKQNVANLVCSNFPLVNFMRCNKKLNVNYSGNMFFTLPEDLPAKLEVPSIWQSFF